MDGSLASYVLVAVAFYAFGASSIAVGIAVWAACARAGQVDDDM